MTRPARGRRPAAASADPQAVADLIARWGAGMNEGQRAAFLHDEGKALAIAGAGTGKTRVLTHRAARLVLEGKAPAGGVLCLTFTADAAAEMRSRTGKLVADAAAELGMEISGPEHFYTFHALILMLARRFPDFAQAIGFDEDGRGPSLLDPASERGRDIIAEAIEKAGHDSEPAEGEPDPVQLAIAGISALKGWLATPDTAAEVAEREAARLVARGVAPPQGLDLALEVWPFYEEEMTERGCIDFDDLIGLAVRALEDDAGLMRLVCKAFPFIMGDEQQDASEAQMRLLLLLAPHGNLFLVGDEDQMLYGWRQADADVLLDFAADPAVTTYLIVEHYRCSRTNLAAAVDIIQRNSVRLGKVLVPHDSRPEGVPILVSRLVDEEDEARWIAAEIGRMRQQEPDLEIAVLVRLKIQIDIIADALDAAGIPHTAGRRRSRSGAPPVVMKTIFGAKGLEYPIVFLPGWADKVMPSRRSVREGREEEERNLAYVAITRGIRQVLITVPRSFGERLTDLKDSRFIGEIDPTRLVHAGLPLDPWEAPPPPSSKQWRFVRMIAHAMNIEVSDRILADRARMSVWLDYWKPRWEERNTVKGKPNGVPAGTGPVPAGAPPPSGRSKNPPPESERYRNAVDSFRGRGRSRPSSQPSSNEGE